MSKQLVIANRVSLVVISGTIAFSALHPLWYFYTNETDFQPLLAFSIVSSFLSYFLLSFVVRTAISRVISKYRQALAVSIVIATIMAPFVFSFVSTMASSVLKNDVSYGWGRVIFSFMSMPYFCTSIVPFTVVRQIYRKKQREHREFLNQERS